MPHDLIVIPRCITRKFVKAHSEWNFLWGGTHYGEIYAGQGLSCIGMSNCYKIPTKYRNCKSDSAAFFQDNHFDSTLKFIIDRAFQLVPSDKSIIPFPKIGMGCAQLQSKAPGVLKYIQQKIDAIKYPNIQYYG